MKDRYKKRLCRMLVTVITVILLIAGCADKKADGFTELELGQQKESTAETGDEKVAGQEDTAPGTVYVYVCGAVNAPGVYELASSARVYEAVASAGGAREDAAAEALNQARMVTDGERIYMPTLEEQEKGIVDGKAPQVTGTDNSNGGKININTADREELKTLPGIGDAKAGSIISYRDSNGGFRAVEELMNVEGIKEGVFNKIKDKIIVA